MSRSPRLSARRLLALLLIGGLATLPAAADGGPARGTLPPVLMVHGIDDDHTAMTPLRRRLEQQGYRHLAAVDLVPNDGRAGIDVLALQVGTAAKRLCAGSGGQRIAIVAFSMGALVSRYWLQRCGGQPLVRTFVSISGPQHGTVMAYSRLNEGGRQMRPGSPLLADLARDPAPWRDTRVFAFWTPYDLVIVPQDSSALPGATLRTFPVLLHPWMLTDPGVAAAVTDALRS